MTLLVGLPGHSVRAPWETQWTRAAPSRAFGIGAAASCTGSTSAQLAHWLRKTCTIRKQAGAVAGSLGSNPAFATWESRDLGQVTLTVSPFPQ